MHRLLRKVLKFESSTDIFELFHMAVRIFEVQAMEWGQELDDMRFQIEVGGKTIHDVEFVAMSANKSLSDLV